jgi:hypothetical protein
VGAGLSQQLGAALGGRLRLQGGQDGIDLFGRTEMLRHPAEPGLSGGVARVQELAVQALEYHAVDNLAVPESKVSQAGPPPLTGRLAALLRGRQVVVRARLGRLVRLSCGPDLPPGIRGIVTR